MKPGKLRLDIRYLLIAVLAGFLGGLGWLAYSAAGYFRTSPRFEVRNLTVSGLKRVEENRVIAAAGFEVGANVFNADLDVIRERVEQLPWVRHALVQRVLPDQITIKVVERVPVGLARIRRDLYHFDVEARILELDPGAETSFPILNGLRPEDDFRNAVKVGTYRRILEELGETELSEVHISDSGDVSVVSASDPLMISLGGSDFRNRWIRYLQLKMQIQRQYPDAVRVDLRFKNQVIIKMKDDPSGELILWDAEKRTL